MEQNKSFNEHPHPCVGVMYPAFLNDVEPATGRDLPPDGMTLEEIENMVVTVNEPFDMSKVINPDDYPLPKEGTVGYVKIESVNYEGERPEPRIFEMAGWQDATDC